MAKTIKVLTGKCRIKEGMDNFCYIDKRNFSMNLIDFMKEFEGEQVVITVETKHDVNYTDKVCEGGVQ